LRQELTETVAWLADQISNLIMQEMGLVPTGENTDVHITMFHVDCDDDAE
jgi:hypothetical protein